MANAIVETDIKVTLILSEEEAKFIKSLIKNPHPAWEHDEPISSRDIRQGIFHVLKDIDL